MTSVLLVEADELSGVFGKISIELGVSCAVLSGDMGEWERNKAETVLLTQLRCSDAEVECQTPQIDEA